MLLLLSGGSLLLLSTTPSSLAQQNQSPTLPMNRVKVSLSPMSVTAQVQNGKTTLALGMAIDITYESADPPNAIYISDSNVSSSTNYSPSLGIIFGAPWIQIFNGLWKPSLVQNGPYLLPDSYLLSPSPSLNAWPKENLSAFIDVGVSTKSVSNESTVYSVTLLTSNPIPRMPGTTCSSF